MLIWQFIYQLTSVSKILQNNTVCLKLKISKQGKLSMLVVASWPDDVKPIILSCPFLQHQM